LNAWKCKFPSLLRFFNGSPTGCHHTYPLRLLPYRRVAELEQENARLLALTQNGSPSPNPTSHPDEEAIAENERLRAQLAAAEERERELSTELARKLAVRDLPVKAEPTEPPFSQSRSLQSPHKSAASFGLMVSPLCPVQASPSAKPHW